MNLESFTAAMRVEFSKAKLALRDEKPMVQFTAVLSLLVSVTVIDAVDSALPEMRRLTALPQGLPDLAKWPVIARSPPNRDILASYDPEAIEKRSRTIERAMTPVYDAMRKALESDGITEARRLRLYMTCVSMTKAAVQRHLSETLLTAWDGARDAMGAPNGFRVVIGKVGPGHSGTSSVMAIAGVTETFEAIMQEMQALGPYGPALVAANALLNLALFADPDHPEGMLAWWIDSTPAPMPPLMNPPGYVVPQFPFDARIDDHKLAAPLCVVTLYGAMRKAISDARVTERETVARALGTIVCPLGDRSVAKLAAAMLEAADVSDATWGTVTLFDGNGATQPLEPGFAASITRISKALGLKRDEASEMLAHDVTTPPKGGRPPNRRREPEERPDPKPPEALN